MMTITQLPPSTTPRADKDLIYSLILAVTGLSCAGESLDVTPDDETDLPHVSNKGLIVTTDGDIAVIFTNSPVGSMPLIRTVKAGVHYPWNVRRIVASGTTATGIAIFFDRQ